MPTFEEVARSNVPAEVAAGGSNSVEQYVSDWTNWAASGGADSVEHMQNSMVAAQISAGETPAQVYTGTTSPTYGGTDSGGGGGLTSTGQPCCTSATFCRDVAGF